MLVTLRLRRGTASEWTTANPVLGDGEVGWEDDTHTGKVGDGTSNWAALSYSLGVATVAPGSIDTADLANSVVTTAKLADSAVTPIKTLLDSGMNVIVNPGFESGSTIPHSPGGGATLVMATANVRSGTKACIVGNLPARALDSYGYVLAFNGAVNTPTVAMPVEVGDVVGGYVNVRNNSATGAQFAAYLDHLDDSGTRISNNQGEVKVVSGSYQRSLVTYTVPTGISYVTLNLAVANTTAGMTVLTDDAALFKIPSDDQLPSRLTQANLDARYQLFTTGNSKVPVSRYGVLPTATASTNDAGMATLFTDYPNGVEVVFDRQGDYTFNAKFPHRSNLTITGTGWGTKLHFTAGLFVPTSGQSADHIMLRECYIDNLGATSTPHIVDLSALSGTAYNTGMRWTDVYLKTVVASGSILKLVNSATTISLYGWRVRNSRMDMASTCTDPAIYVSTNTVGVNDWTWDGCLTHSNANTNAQFLFACYAGTNALGFPGLSFKDIIAEQATEGWCNLQGVLGPNLENIWLWDETTYGASAFRFAAAGVGGGIGSFGVRINQCGIVATGGATFSGANDVVRITGSGTSTSHNVGTVYNGAAKATALFT